MAQADPKFALNRVAQKVLELNEKRLVQPEGTAQFANLLRGRVLPKQEDHWVTHVLEQQERQEGDRDQNAARLEQSIKQKNGHPCSDRSRSSRVPKLQI